MGRGGGGGSGGGGGGHSSSGGGHSVSHSGGGHTVSGGFSSGRSSGNSFSMGGTSHYTSSPNHSQLFRSEPRHTRTSSPPPSGSRGFGGGPTPPPPARHNPPPPPPRRTPPPPPPMSGMSGMMRDTMRSGVYRSAGYCFGGYMGGMGAEPYERRLEREARRTVASVTKIVAALIILMFIAVIVVLNKSEATPNSTIVRHKLEDVPAYNNNCIIDETGEFKNVSYVATKLKDFYDLTGVQPYIIWKAYDESLQTEYDKEEWALTYYDENIDAENTFLYVYFEDYHDQGNGYMYYVNGTKSVAVMDSEAVEIFWNYIDAYWWDDISTDSLFIKVFTTVGEVIMREPTNGWDFAVKAIIVVAVIVVIAGIILIIKVRANAKHQEALDTERILKTPVEKIGGNSGSISSMDISSPELDEALSKYGEENDNG